MADGIFPWCLACVVAPVIGSFLGVLVTRLPAGEPVVWDRSRCPACGTTLAAIDLVPLVSWLALRGRCRTCDAPVSRFYPAIELAALAVALWAAAAVDGWLLWATCGLGWLLLALAVIDAGHLLLPDVLTLPLAALGLVVAWALPTAALSDHLIGAAAGYGSLTLVAWSYRRLRGIEGLGGGDAKLLAAAGAWTGWMGLPGIVLIAALSALALIAGRTVVGHALDRGTPLPLGPHLCLATWLVWLYGPVTFG